MLSNSQDVLNIVLAVSAGLLAVFLCWALLYAIMVLRDLYHIVGSLRKKFDAVTNFVGLLKEKVAATATATTILSKAASEIANYIKKRNRKKASHKVEVEVEE
ncbi:MAG: hypothetical protein A2445_01810 [Candidatus Jacksonbacteria bacterium RIFOXYC2_FULL_44_29]|nr:MAG: hypothetical protein UW45_C0006G0014 [Parcubacteria group bacterium GW2011_GWC2_44_22]OGY75593.1 MAG: hypothetical protein A2295_05235 [Candidatus Jacksonbacteria bacterium RIFOXYB2_FULL_44_15]OGY75687.1 MAG: hypothetical protein A2240_04010 [Candidatus Jacksonbacteria bacterium RIFOXYA2_FULL_43_12]OGY77581.1 MAG: hypothetical protein A2445_01810 [Candidatus Jacksonbacteria bacterium RIFOXYC2_FULL_44_29]OGY81747.1 MAG: hypothetical protein A2550_01090 [Candidatus Jacksonbacteria bacteri